MSWGSRSRLGHAPAVLWALLLGCFSTEGQWSPGADGEFLDTVKVSAVTGGEAALPCDTHSPQPSDLLLLVVWYKDDVPVYSYDSRIKGSEANWRDDMLGDRAEWHATVPSTLKIRNVVPEDRALYRCRVDFKISPTKNQKILLDVIELPEQPKVYDDLDKEVSMFAGPYVEDSSLKLTCVVSGGNPKPRVRWWRNDIVVSTLAAGQSSVSVLDLRIARLSRDQHEAVYSCTADNTALVAPLRTNVQIQLQLRPLSVEILTKEQPLSVQQTAEVSCRTTGARPPAIITWWLDNEQLNAVQKDTESQNETLSVIRWTPRMANNGQTLTCRASHAVLKHAAIEAHLMLNLHYVPLVVLKLGSQLLSPRDIEEGGDVYFTCEVQAYPPAYKILWEHNHSAAIRRILKRPALIVGADELRAELSAPMGEVITYNQRARVLAAAGHLALRGVSRGRAGNYSCTASNVEGDGSSPPFQLNVIYKPVCKSQSTTRVGVGIGERVNLTCRVDAYPRPETYHWYLNNSQGFMEIDTENLTSGDGSSITFAARSAAEYGAVSCRASNAGGLQAEPCRFALHRPYNCSTGNLTDDSVELQCDLGYDGDVHSSYCVEAWEAGRLVLNVSRREPAWTLRGLGSGKTLRLVFYAFDGTRRTEITTLRVHTRSKLALHRETIATNLDLNWTTKMLAGLSAAILLAMAMWRVILTVLVRNGNRRPIQYAAPVQILKVNGSNGNRSPLQPDDKNPDVVPLEKGLNCRESDQHPEPPRYGVTSLCQVSGEVRSAHSLHEVRFNAHIPNALPDAQSIGTLADDRSAASGTTSRRREIVTTRTPLLENARESYV